MPDSQAVTSGSVNFPASDYGNPDPEWLKVDWRRHLHRVELPGAVVNYAEIGEGEPILFVHGLAGCWRNWLENLPENGAGGAIVEEVTWPPEPAAARSRASSVLSPATSPRSILSCFSQL